MTFDSFLLLVNAAFCLRVLVVNLHEARHGFKEWAWTRYGVVIFAVVYMCSYLLLLSGAVDRLDWSHVMVGISIPVWEVVWVRPALRTKNVRHTIIAEGVAQIADKRAERERLQAA